MANLFLLLDGRHFIIPNSWLYDKPITQYKRSKDYAVYLSVAIGFDTDRAKIALFEKKVLQWLKQDTVCLYLSLSVFSLIVRHLGKPMSGCSGEILYCSRYLDISVK